MVIEIKLNKISAMKGGGPDEHLKKGRIRILILRIGLNNRVNKKQNIAVQL